MPGLASACSRSRCAQAPAFAQDKQARQYRLIEDTALAVGEHQYSFSLVLPRQLGSGREFKKLRAVLEQGARFGQIVVIL